jgi:hypothetical protein
MGFEISFDDWIEDDDILQEAANPHGEGVFAYRHQTYYCDLIKSTDVFLRPAGLINKGTIVEATAIQFVSETRIETLWIWLKTLLTLFGTFSTNHGRIWLHKLFVFDQW